MEGDQTFNTTLQMQEEWLATVDALLAREGELVVALEKAPMALFSARNIPEKRVEWFRRYNAWHADALALAQGKKA